jgi:hypothetical protein
MKQVDILALTRIENEVARDLVNLQAAYGDVPPDPEYWHTVVLCAARLFRAGGVDEGFRVLVVVPPDYIRGPMVEQMEQDPDFADVARIAADALIDAGRARPPAFVVDHKQAIVQRQFARA